MSFSGINPHSVLVLDNVSIHHVDGIVRMDELEMQILQELPRWLFIERHIELMATSSVTLNVAFELRKSSSMGLKLLSIPSSLSSLCSLEKQNRRIHCHPLFPEPPDNPNSLVLAIV